MKRMSKLKSLRRLWSERGLLVALAVIGAVLLGIAAPASAQLFPFFGGGPQQHQRPQRGGFFENPFFAPFQRQAPPPQQRAPERREDYSRAPPPDKRDAAATEHNVLVLGDAMADWLGYGLEDALSETPELGVIRKHKTVSGLIRYQPKGDPADWAAAAKEILATEKPEAIVVMLGLHDRMPIRETASDKKPDKKDAKGKPVVNAPADAATTEVKPGDPAAPDDPVDPDLQIATPEKNTRSPQGVYQFRDERWAELYSKKIDEMIGVLKTKGVPVLWVGLPAVRGTKSTSDTLFLNTLYRDAAGRAGITYVDVWDGFVDESGRYLQQGPDFEGQIRRLRSYDGVYFTKAGARKLAHYVEREINRLLASRSAPIELPSEPGAPDAEAKPDGPAPRPIAGPIMPLVASSVGTDELLGGAGARPAAVDPLAARTLVKGDALSAPAGRADDAAWPRREVARERAGDPVVATVAPAAATAGGAARAAEKPKRHHVVRQADRPVIYGDKGQQRRIYVQRPQMLPPPPGPGDWLSRLFR
jgi:hypothetical protein